MLTIGHTLHLPWLGLSVFSWCLLYLSLRRLEPQRKAEWHCRLVTVIHGSLICLMSAWSGFVQGPWVFTDAGGPNTPLQVMVVTVCVGYFLFDFTWCLYFQTEGFPMLMHHFLSIFGMLFMLVAGKYGTEMVATIFGSELTNPLLQLRWFLRETGRYNTLAGEVVDFLFMAAFFTLRIGIGSLLLFSYFQQPTPDFWGRLGGVVIYLIGWMFWISIFRYAVYKYNKKRQRRNGEESRPGVAASLGIGKGGESGVTSKSGGSTNEQVPVQETVGRGGASAVSQNGVFHRNNGGVSLSKGAGSANEGVSSVKESEAR